MLRDFYPIATHEALADLCLAIENSGTGAQSWPAPQIMAPIRGLAAYLRNNSDSMIPSGLVTNALKAAHDFMDGDASHPVAADKNVQDALTKADTAVNGPPKKDGNFPVKLVDTDLAGNKDKPDVAKPESFEDQTRREAEAATNKPLIPPVIPAPVVPAAAAKPLVPGPAAPVVK